MIVFVPVGLRREAGVSESLTWAASVLEWGGEPLSWSGTAGVEDDNDLYQRRKILTRKGFPFWAGCDSRLAKEIRHVSMHCSSGRLRQH